VCLGWDTTLAMAPKLIWCRVALPRGGATHVHHSTPVVNFCQ
jgi:hypothetical protein